jgi:hypothetical protein
MTNFAQDGVRLETWMAALPPATPFARDLASRGGRPRTLFYECLRVKPKSD